MESGESGSELPGEITCFEILPRLPAKSLMRFKCVCKSWSSLTRNPSFVTAHQNLSSNKHTNLLLTTWDKPSRQQHFFSLQIDQQGSLTPATHLLNLPTVPQTWGERLYNAQSIKGLVCIHLHNTSFPNHTDPDYPTFIFNPCTRESMTLPYTSPASLTTYVAHHFGFSPLTNEYKVVQVQSFIPSMRDWLFSFKIFKLGTSSWRHIEVHLNDLPFDPLHCPFHRSSVCINGAIHWLHVTQNIVVAFDIGDEKFRTIALPNDYNSVKLRVNYPLRNIVEVGRCLALTGDKQLIMKENKMGLWILKDYENQVWVKETITLPFPSREIANPVPFCSIHTGELLIYSRLSRDDPGHVRVHLYNMETTSFRGSVIVLPDEWVFLNGARLKLLTSYEDSIVPLR